MMIHQPFARALKAAGVVTNPNEILTYQDYLYELMADGFGKNPVTEQQWETLCDMQGKRRLYFASNSKSALERAERKCLAQPTS